MPVVSTCKSWSRSSGILFLALSLPILFVALNLVKSAASFEQFTLTRNYTKCVQTSLPRVYLVFEKTTFRYFDDWITPFLDDLETTFEVIRYTVHRNTESRVVTLQTDLRKGDTVLLLQRSFEMPLKDGVQYWFLNTEGPDKNFADIAIAQGFRNVIDYCSFNSERFSKLGAESSLWLPIVRPPTVMMHTFRSKLCIVGGANTSRRKLFVDQFNRATGERGLNISIFEVRGWKLQRDVVSQTCALVLNIASKDSNHATPRLRLDVLWQFDIPIISEEMSGDDPLEYRGTVVFVPLPQLLNASLSMWANITSGEYPGSLSQRAEARQIVYESRLTRFKKVTQVVKQKALEVYSCKTEVGRSL